MFFKSIAIYKQKFSVFYKRATVKQSLNKRLLTESSSQLNSQNVSDIVSTVNFYEAAKTFLEKYQS